MESIKRVRDIDPADVPVVERALDQSLDPTSDQVLIVRVVTPSAREESTRNGVSLPEWCDVLDGMTDEELAEFDAIVSVRPRRSQDAE